MLSSFPCPQQSLTEEKADLNSTNTDLTRVSQNTDDDHSVQDNMGHLNSRHQCPGTVEKVFQGWELI